MTFRFAANLGFLWKELPLAERIRRAARAGFDAVEFHDFSEDVDIPAAARLIDSLGIGVTSLNTAHGSTSGRAAIPGSIEQARLEIDRAVHIARQFGARAIHVLAGIVEPGAQSRETFRANLDHACGVAQTAGTGVLIEPISRQAVPGYFLSDFDQAAEIVEQVGHPELRIMFDCYHVAAMGYDIEKCFSRYGSLVGHVQFAGIPHRHEPDSGLVDYAVLLPRIQTLGYAGLFGSEYVPRSEVEAGLGWLEKFRE